MPSARSPERGDEEAGAQAFEEAAKASSEKDPETARMYAAAGNMWLASGQAGKAALDLDKALAFPGLEAEQRGEALLDRARAAEAQDDLKTARARWTEAADRSATTHSIGISPPRSPSAKMIRRRRIHDRQGAILAPSDPAVLFEAGHVADFLGDETQARNYWARAAALDPQGPVGKAAAKAHRNARSHADREKGKQPD